MCADDSIKEPVHKDFVVVCISIIVLDALQQGSRVTDAECL